MIQYGLYDFARLSADEVNFRATKETMKHLGDAVNEGLVSDLYDAQIANGVDESKIKDKLLIQDVSAKCCLGVKRMTEKTLQ